MATKIRLQRFGRKSYAYYHVVIADERAPRDGKFIERIGSYNPNTNPATVSINFEAALKWVMTGAQPTDTVRNLLSEEGVMMKKHLLGGVAKGAFTEEQAEEKFAAWKANKTQEKAQIIEKLASASNADAATRLAAEKEVNAARAAEQAKKKADELEAIETAAKEKEEAAKAAEAPEEEAAAEEVTEEAPAE